MIGRTLSHFEITGQLGEGGMGTVYRAMDTKLGREVAIKVLPDAFTADAERLARFEREAKVLASLNHPSIAGIYEVGETEPSAGSEDSAVGSLHFLVMELAEGENLAERLSRGPISVEQALPIAQQIAEALEAAHENGVVHRDLKPANIMLAPDGRVKVLDFGLAKAMETVGAVSGDLSHSPTLTAQMTSVGMILGTAAYMSPEQAKGEEADKRSDIWSFGIVLWEMLVGQKTFNENTVSETLAAVLKSDPDHSVLPMTVPLAVRRLIERCLQKDPKQRLHDIADARLEIEAVLRGDDSALAMGTVDSPASERGPWKTIAVIASVVAIAALATHLLPDTSTGPAGRLPVSLAVDRPAAHIDNRGPAVAVSPDGTRVIYKSVSENFSSDMLYVRDLDSIESHAIPGTEGGIGPVFSPDGSRILFARASSLFSLALSGGAPTEISSDLANFRGAAWADDGSIWFSPDTEAGLWRMNADGSEPQQMTSPDPDRKERTHRWPTVVPGSDLVLFTVGTSDIDAFDEARIDVLRVSTGERKTVVDGGSFPLWVEPEYLLYAYSGALMAARFNTETLEIEELPVAVVEKLKTLPLSGAALAAVSTEGSLAVGIGDPQVDRRRLRAYDSAGNGSMASDEIRPYQGVALSPDETTLALDIDGANAAIWLMDLERGIQTRLTSEWSHNLPVWSPDGQRIITSSSSGGTYQLHLHDLDSGHSEVIYASREHQIYAISWSVDDLLTAAVFPKGSRPQVWILPLVDTSSHTVLVEGNFESWAAHFSPDGRWVSYASGESGRLEVYVVSSSGGGRKTRVSSDGGGFPRWSRDGRELFFLTGLGGAENTMMTASITAGDRLQIGRPVPLFDAEFVFPGSNVAFDVDSDGNFYVIEFVSDMSQFGADLVFTRHWIDLLRAKLGAG